MFQHDFWWAHNWSSALHHCTRPMPTCLSMLKNYSQWSLLKWLLWQEPSSTSCSNPEALFYVVSINLVNHYYSEWFKSLSVMGMRLRHSRHLCCRRFHFLALDATQMSAVFVLIGWTRCNSQDNSDVTYGGAGGKLRICHCVE